MARAQATMTPQEVAFWEQRMRDGRLLGSVPPDGAPCLECGEPTYVNKRRRQRHRNCYYRFLKRQSVGAGP